MGQAIELSKHIIHVIVLSLSLCLYLCLCLSPSSIIPTLVMEKMNFGENNFVPKITCLLSKEDET